MARKINLNRQLLGLEDLLFGEGIETQTRCGQEVIISKINIGNLPFNETQTLLEWLNSTDITTLISSIPELLSIYENLPSLSELATSTTEIIEAVDKYLGVSVTINTLNSGAQATASYDSLTGILTLGIPKGDIGPQGPKGDIGPQGPKGDIGPKGDTGDIGPKGDIGLTGPKGDIGPQGPKGDIGLTGPKGDIGPQGPKGDKGDIGLTGPKGDIGLTGPKGDIGLTGPKGDIGPQGPQGPQGPKGDTGNIETGGIGSYVFALYTNNANAGAYTIAPGGTVAGSKLYYCDAAGRYLNGTITNVSMLINVGTWKCMGAAIDKFSTSEEDYSPTLWLRIA